MKKLASYAFSFAMAGFAVWIFSVWRLAGMPDPGFTGRLLPLAWFLAALLNGTHKPGRWFVPVALSFTVGAWLWMLCQNCWVIAAAIPVSGLVVWGIEVARRGPLSVIRALLPVLFLSLAAAEINGDEVRFAEQASRISGIAGERYGQVHMRSGDITPDESHHTPLFPIVISPGLLAGEMGLRIVPVVIAVSAVFLLAELTTPSVAVALALLYPGFSIFGLAMTGWLAAGLFTLTLLLPTGKKWFALRIFVAFLLVALKMRYAGLALGIIIAEYPGFSKDKLKLRLPVLVVLALTVLLVVDRYLLGGAVFWSRYGNIEALRLLFVNLFERPIETLVAAGWSVFDPEAGLLPRAPWVIASLAGLFVMRRKSPLLLKRLLIPSLLYWFFLVVWLGSAWHGLPAPAGRMFVPMLPLFASGLVFVWNDKKTRVLLALSVAVTALVIVAPYTRYNYADGTDSVFSLLGVATSFSMVRGSPLMLLPALFLVVSFIITYEKGSGKNGFAYLLLFAGVLLLHINRGGLEAEDIGAEYVQGAPLYPRTPDPLERYFWPFGRERMLELGEPGQSVVLPGLESGDTLFLHLSGSGGTIMVGAESLKVETPLGNVPSVYRAVGRSGLSLPDRPENRFFQTYSVRLRSCDIEDGLLRIVYLEGPPVYFDRIDASGEHRWL